MRTLLAALLLLLLPTFGCGKEIGDECVIDTDCSQSGDRKCVDQHCTIQGCDYDTCPEEAVCVQFFTGGFTNPVCDPASEDSSPEVDVCSYDELCSLVGHCVPRSSEIRFCMRSCESDGDCPDGFECRDLDLMKAHGGQPVPPPGSRVDPTNVQGFCARAPAGG